MLYNMQRTLTSQQLMSNVVSDILNQKQKRVSICVRLRQVP